MRTTRPFLGALAVLSLLAFDRPWARAESGTSTRIHRSDQHQRQGPKRYPYREKSAYILRELDLQRGDVVVDVGAGDGWWAEKFAEVVGQSGVVHAAEVDAKKVKRMKERFADTPQVNPCLIGSDNTGLPANSCDVAFFSQSYHHLNQDGHVDYLKHLSQVLKPTGRVVIIEKYTETGLAAGTHGTRLSRLVRQAEEAAWVPVRLELMTGTYHYVAILAKQKLFPPEPEKDEQNDAGKPKPANESNGKSHTRDSLETVQERLVDDRAVLIDVREQDEWDAGHIEEATLIPLSRLQDRAMSPAYAAELSKTLSKDRIIYCHCRSGGRVLLAAPILQEMGYDARPLKAGYADLLKAGFPKASRQGM